MCGCEVGLLVVGNVMTGEPVTNAVGSSPVGTNTPLPEPNYVGVASGINMRNGNEVR